MDDDKDPFVKDTDDKEIDDDLIAGEVDILDDDILGEDITETVEDDDDETPLWEEEE